MQEKESKMFMDLIQAFPILGMLGPIENSAKSNSYPYKIFIFYKAQLKTPEEMTGRQQQRLGRS